MSSDTVCDVFIETKEILYSPLILNMKNLENVLLCIHQFLLKVCHLLGLEDDIKRQQPLSLLDCLYKLRSLFIGIWLSSI